MTEIKINRGLIETVSMLEQLLGERRYWLHNRVAGADWEVNTAHGCTVVKLRDPKMLTFLMLKLK